MCALLVGLPDVRVSGVRGVPERAHISTAEHDPEVPFRGG
jgi:hypothetical protein